MADEEDLLEVLCEFGFKQLYNFASADLVAAAQGLSRKRNSGRVPWGHTRSKGLGCLVKPRSGVIHDSELLLQAPNCLFLGFGLKREIFLLFDELRQLIRAVLQIVSVLVILHDRVV
jgi:hypothetical protein